MTKTIEQWLLYRYVGLEFTPLSKPLKARMKYPERERRMIGVGVIRKVK
jgi:hypothetical protein